MNRVVNRPLVSVLMTAYNREQFISEAIESVLASSYLNFELIIVDDGSMDNTVAIAKKYLAEDSRMQLHINEKNLGDYPNRNRAASLSKGKYIMFCDSDDSFFEDTIEYCVSAMEENLNAKMGMYYAGEVDHPFLLNSSKAIMKHFFNQPFLTIGPGGTILNKKFFDNINGYPVKYGPANDMYFNLKVCSKGDVLLLPKLFLNYRIHSGQEKNNLYGYIHYNYRYLNDALNELDLGLDNNQLTYLRNKNSRRFVSNLFNHFKENKNISSIKDLWIKADFNLQSLFTGIFH